MKWRVRLMQPKVNKKGFPCCRRFFDKCARSLGILVHGNLLSRAVKGTVFVVPILARQGRVGNHIVRQMPFPIVRGCVSALL